MTAGNITGIAMQPLQTEKNPMEEIDDALKTCTFGRFQIRLLFTSFFAIMNSVLISNTSPYILPNAECDLNMSLLQKGILNGAPFVGMCLSAILAGFLTDAFGRKVSLVYGFGGIAFFTMLSSVCQNFEMLIIGKFFEGLFFGAAYNSAMTYTSEFCHSNVRDRVMLLQTSYQSVGVVSLALISWGILPQEWEISFFNGRFALHTWNFYLLLSSLWPLIAFILYCFLPESPKYLLTQHKYAEARAVIINVYKENTRKAESTFPFPDLWKKNENEVIDSGQGFDTKRSFRHVLVTGFHNSMPLFRRPLSLQLALICLLMFAIIALYNIVRFWFPQISTIVEHYSNNSSEDLCVILDAYTKDQRLKVSNNNVTLPKTCVPAKSGTETYINSIIIGGACILPYILSGVLVNKVGKRCLIMASGAITVACTLWLRWASSKTQVVSIFATDLAVTQVMMSLVIATTMEVFPTSTRTLAISTIMTSGRIGTLVGNIFFPVLLDMGCSIPFFVLGGVMALVTILSVLLPKS